MKVAMWGLGLLGLSIVGLVLISLFGNITVTNQLNYTTMKNTVEASMMDSLDVAHYRTGFCVCTNKEKTTVNGKQVWSFNSSSEYIINDVKYDDGTATCEGTKEKPNCELLEGEYKINPDVFAESLVRRFAEMVNNNKDYQIIIQDIIEYPPKVSIRVNSNDNQAFGDGEFTISNQIDAIIESNNSIVEETTTEIVDSECIERSCGDEGRWYVCRDKDGNVCRKVDLCANPSCSEEKRGNSIYRVCKTTSGVVCSSELKETITETTVEPGGNVRPRCFLAGTKIQTNNGKVDINKLKLGDYVLTYNEDKKINEYKKITYVFVFEDSHEELYTIKTKKTELNLTGHHRVYTTRNDKFEYIAAMELKIGDIVMYPSGEYDVITEISHKPINNTVYNLETADNHNFYAGDKGVLVHNATPEDKGANAGGRVEAEK